MGNPIAHSLSPVIHQHFAEQTGISLRYDKIEVPVALFEQYVIDFFNQPEGKGLNITLPFKERAFAMAQVKSARCLQAGAANTLWMANGQRHADNTDGVGLIRDLSHYIDLADKTVVLLGAGGAARGVIGELLNAHPARLILSNRTVEKAHALGNSFPEIHTCGFEALTEHYDVIINATSASLQDNTLTLPDSILNNHPFCYDLAYSRDKMTPFVQWAKSHGSQAMDGLGMLIEQAAEAFLIWHGIMPDTTSLKRSLKKRND
jgi:shikimate dehydrogenase